MNIQEYSEYNLTGFPIRKENKTWHHRTLASIFNGIEIDEVYLHTFVSSMMPEQYISQFKDDFASLLNKGVKIVPAEEVFTDKTANEIFDFITIDVVFTSNMGNFRYVSASSDGWACIISKNGVAYFRE